jgi:N-methylhydantoinase B/oxoprolinase/acetone carboxylase alpha subunit
MDSYLVTSLKIPKTRFTLPMCSLSRSVLKGSGGDGNARSGFGAENKSVNCKFSTIKNFVSNKSYEVYFSLHQ